MTDYKESNRKFADYCVVQYAVLTRQDLDIRKKSTHGLGTPTTALCNGKVCVTGYTSGPMAAPDFCIL